MPILTRITPDSLRGLVRKLKDQVYFRRKIGRAPAAMVYQMGKVGSSSIYRSLRRHYPGVVAHAHSFTAGDGRSLVQSLHDWAIVNSQPLKVISLTREPVGRNVSSFFQNFERFTGTPFAEAAFSIEELRDIFLESYTHETPLTWFDRHILPNFDIDVYSRPFPESGVCTYRKDNIELLVMRVEISDDEKIAALRRFLDMEHFELRNINLSREKDYSRTYREFRSSVKFPVEYLDRLCESKYFQHFYDDLTREALIAKWAEPVREAA